jgi:hypothetical protein
MINEHQLWHDVLDELEYEPSVNAAHIGVGLPPIDVAKVIGGKRCKR